MASYVLVSMRVGYRCAGIAAAEHNCARRGVGVLLLRSEEVTYPRESHP